MTGLGRPERWFSRPRLVALLAIALYLTVTVVVIAELLAWAFGRPPNWAAAIGPMVGGLGGAAFGTRIKMRRMATPGMWAEYREALRTGVLPPGAENSDWPALLADRQRELQQSAIVQYVVGGLLGVGWLALLIGHRMDDWGWLVGAGLALLIALSVRASRWQLQRLERLQRQLDTRH